MSRLLSYFWPMRLPPHEEATIRLRALRKQDGAASTRGEPAVPSLSTSLG